VKIADFGLAKQSADAMSTVCGTPQYVAPEVIQGTAHTVYGPEVGCTEHLCAGDPACWVLLTMHACCKQRYSTVYWALHRALDTINARAGAPGGEVQKQEAPHQQHACSIMWQSAALVVEFTQQDKPWWPNRA
jgi:serine/threonine protein kinase